MKHITLIIFLLLFFACTRKDKEHEELLGYWGDVERTEQLITLRKSTSLPENDYGLAFMNNGKLVERKNSGSCGTPPIIYDNYNGDWSVTDSVISINVGYWGGAARYEWKIISLTNEELSFEEVNVDFLPE